MSAERTATILKFPACWWGGAVALRWPQSLPYCSRTVGCDYIDVVPSLGYEMVGFVR